MNEYRHGRFKMAPQRLSPPHGAAMLPYLDSQKARPPGSMW
jgi:hypothetical protein